MHDTAAYPPVMKSRGKKSAAGRPSEGRVKMTIHVQQETRATIEEWMGQMPNCTQGQIFDLLTAIVPNPQMLVAIFQTLPHRHRVAVKKSGSRSVVCATLKGEPRFYWWRGEWRNFEKYPPGQED
jgi:hypothetical protein